KGASQTVSGELIVTSISGAYRLLTPALADFQAAHPDVTVRFLTDLRLFRLDSGEAHVAIRVGARPEVADRVVQKFVSVKNAVLASHRYIEAMGMPKDDADLARHGFVAADNPQARAPVYTWLRAHVPVERMRFRTTEPGTTEAA